MTQIYNTLVTYFKKLLVLNNNIRNYFTIIKNKISRKNLVIWLAHALNKYIKNDIIYICIRVVPWILLFTIIINDFYYYKTLMSFGKYACLLLFIGITTYIFTLFKVIKNEIYCDLSLKIARVTCLYYPGLYPALDAYLEDPDPEDDDLPLTVDIALDKFLPHAVDMHLYGKLGYLDDYYVSITRGYRLQMQKLYNDIEIPEKPRWEMYRTLQAKTNDLIQIMLFLKYGERGTCQYYKKNYIANILTLIGIMFLFSYIWVRFLRYRLPRDIPFQLNLWGFIIMIFIIVLLLIVLKQLIKPSTKFIEKLPKNLVASYYKLYVPWHSLDIAIKNNHFIRNFVNIILNKFIKLVTDKKMYKYNFLVYISITQIPKLVLLIIFLSDIFYFQRFDYYYKYIIMGIIPVIVRYILHIITFMSTLYLEIFEENHIVQIISKDTENSNYCIKVGDLKKWEGMKSDNIYILPTYFIQLQLMAYEKNLQPYEFKMFRKPTQAQKNTNNIIANTPQEVSLFSKVISYFTDILHSTLSTTPENIVTLLIEYKMVVDLFVINEKNPGIVIFNILLMILYLTSWIYILIISFHTLDLLEVTNILNSFIKHLHSLLEI